MGYTTNFRGELKFTKPLTAEQKLALMSMFDEDCRDRPDFGARRGLSYIDLEFNKDETGLQHNGAEKTYDFEEIVNVVLTHMRKTFPDFGLAGSLLAQGEEVGDVWRLVIGEDGLAARHEVVTDEKQATCPECGHQFAA